jgi:hypothetical protein
MTPRTYIDGKEYEIIFDGYSLQDWRMCGPGAFVLRDEAIVTEGGMGLLWYKKKRFRDFVLKVDWKTSRKEDNSGIFVRFPNPLNDPWIAVNEGYEIQIYDAEPSEGNATHKTGAIYNFAAPSTIVASKEPGQWNNFEVHAAGHQYTVILNDRKVTEFTGNRQLEGYVGLQNHDSESRVYFGRIAIRVL